MRKTQLWIDTLLRKLKRTGYLLASDAPVDVYADMMLGTARYLERKDFIREAGRDEHGRTIYVQGDKQ